MHSPVSLVVTDLDGTLWGARSRCHPDTLAALAEFDRRGVPVLIATGRRRRSAAAGLVPNDIRRPAVLLNGCHGWDYGRDEQFHRQPFPADEAHAVIDATAALGLSPVVYVDQGAPDCYAADDCSTQAEHLAALRPFVGEGADLHTVVDSHAVLGFAILGADLARLEAAAAALAGAGVGQATTSIDHQYGGGSLMVQPAGVTKWAGVLAYCAVHGLDADRVAAVGDAGNDMGMLEAAAVAVAVEGAPEPVTALADHVIARPDDGGWGTLPELLG